MGNEINGVTITLREIYDSVKDLNKSIERMEGKLLTFEEKALLATEAAKDSQKALKIAEEAYRLAKESQDAIDSIRKEKESRHQWYWRTIFTALLPYLITAIAFLIYWSKVR